MSDLTGLFLDFSVQGHGLCWGVGVGGVGVCVLDSVLQRTRKHGQV